MQEITLFEDWVLLCSIYGTGSYGISVLGLTLDLAGFLIIIRSAKETLVSVKRINAEIHGIELNRLNNIDLKKEAVIRSNEVRIAIEHERESQQASFTGQYRLHARKHLNQKVDQNIKLQSQILTNEDKLSKSEIELANKKTLFASTDFNSFSVAAILIVFGFILQIIGALPCPIDQLPTL